MAFFVGTPDGRNAHDALAERIASAGKQWAKDVWRREDMAACLSTTSTLPHVLFSD